MPHSVKEGDTVTLKWDLDRDLTGVSAARVIISAKVGATPAVDRNGVIDPDPATGIVSLELAAADYGPGKLEPGNTYLVEVETTPGPLTHPDNGYERITILRDLG